VGCRPGPGSPAPVRPLISWPARRGAAQPTNGPSGWLPRVWSRWSTPTTWPPWTRPSAPGCGARSDLGNASQRGAQRGLKPGTHVIELDIAPFTIHLARSEAETAFPHAMIRAKGCSSRRTCRSWQPGQVEEVVGVVGGAWRPPLVPEQIRGNLSVGTGDKWLDDQPALKGSPMGTRTQVCMEGREQSHGGVAALVVLDLEPRPRITER
jgi:hypothetical protein